MPVIPLIAVGLIAATSSATAPTKLADAGSGTCAAYWTVESVTVRPGQGRAARRFYELAWLPARAEAIRRGQIKGYHLLAADGDQGPQIQLITIYADQAQFDARETNFQAIFAALKTPRPLMVDGKTREQIFSDRQGREDYREVETPVRSCP